MLRLYTNCFLPVMKLASKQRLGSKVKKIYEAPLIPYNKLMQSAQAPEKAKRQLRKEYLTLNPAELDRKIAALQGKLAKLAIEKQRVRTMTATTARNRAQMFRSSAASASLGALRPALVTRQP